MKKGAVSPSAFLHARVYTNLRGPQLRPRVLNTKSYTTLTSHKTRKLVRLSPYRTEHIRLLSRTSFVSFLTPPAVFVGIFAVLWTYKCLMMILFQDKIIYMPSVPPFSRSEKLEDYTRQSLPVTWTQDFIRASDGTRLAICVGSNEACLKAESNSMASRLVLLYLQGNGSSTPPRIPDLSRVLKSLANAGIQCTLIALSYRGYWLSSGRASQRGVAKDGAAAIEYCQDMIAKTGKPARFVVWGQSVGAGVASYAVAAHASNMSTVPSSVAIDAMVLETPFTSIRQMLVAMYPQKWLPYRYLWPFLWNWWDSEQALQKLSTSSVKMPLLIITASEDEVVPKELGERLVETSKTCGLEVVHHETRRSLHHEATMRSDGHNTLVKFLKEI